VASQAQVPAVIASGVICFAAGLAIGVGGLWYWKFDPKMSPNPSSGGDVPTGENGKGRGGAMPTKEGMKGPGAGRGGFPGGGFGGKKDGPPGGERGGGGGGRPTSKAQLASLVTKLDQLTTKPLEVKLTDEQRTQIAKQLEGLDAADGVSEEEAKKRLDAILAALEGNKETLEAAGFRWPGDNPPRTPSGDNPFGEGEAKEHLKQLQERVGKGKGS
jgi:hypothetical protein